MNEHTEPHSTRSGLALRCGPGERLLTVEEVAEWLGVPVGTIYAWRYRGCGPVSYKVGRHVRFRREDVEAWLVDQRSDPVEVSPLRRLLGAVPVRQGTRYAVSVRSADGSTCQVGNPLVGRAIRGRGGPSPIPDPTPASCVAGVGDWRRRQGKGGW